MAKQDNQVPTRSPTWTLPLVADGTCLASTHPAGGLWPLWQKEVSRGMVTLDDHEKACMSKEHTAKA
eukprot:Skav200002  [mRNA]  locus=scaffold4475:33886:34596:- [translate_table: standard]